MKHITVADRSLLTGDEAADLLLEYASLLAQAGTADTVDVAALGPDGDDVVVSFLLNGGITMVAETTRSTTPEPDNSKAEQYLRTRIEQLRGQNEFSAQEIAGASVWNERGTE